MLRQSPNLALILRQDQHPRHQHSQCYPPTPQQGEAYFFLCMRDKSQPIMYTRANACKYLSFILALLTVALRFLLPSLRLNGEFLSWRII